MLRGRVGVGFYFYYFSLLEQCGEASSDELKEEYTFHDSTIRNLWCINLKKSERVAIEMMSVGLLEFKKAQNTFQFTIPNLAKYLGKYDSKSISNNPNKRKEKEIKENKIIISDEKKSSPLSFLFSKNPEIQKWLNDGIHETHMMLLKKYSHHELADLIEQAYSWALPRNIRAETWLYTFTSNKNTNAYGANQGQVKFKSKTNGVVPTPENPTGNPYKAQRLAIENKGESA
jgi:hypothetical protein